MTTYDTLHRQAFDAEREATDPVDDADVEMRFWAFNETNKKLPVEERIFDAELIVDYVLNGITLDDDDPDEDDAADDGETRVLQ